MNDSIHKRLTEHIRKTVRRHELPYEPGSWEEFQRLRRQRDHRMPVVWFRYAVAACLLLGVLGVPIWLYTTQPEGIESAYQSQTGRVAETPDSPLVPNRAEPRPKPGQPVSVAAPREKTGADSFAPNATIAGKTTLPPPQITLSKPSANRPAASLPTIHSTTELAPEAGLGKPGTPETSLSQNKTVPEPRFETTVFPASFERIASRSRAPYRWVQRPLGLPLPARPGAGTLAKIDPPKTATQPVLGISLAPQSVSKSGATPALGGGLYSEIPLTRRFSVSTGLSVAQQKWGTKSNQIPFGTVPTLIATDTRLVTVDWPVNIRFRPFYAAKTGFYAEAGLSSVAFLNERSAETYQHLKAVTVMVVGTNGQEQAVTQYVNAQETVNRSQPGFQKMYWGRIANFSVGIERRLNDRFRLSAEPYLKYPIGPFTRENLLLGSGGINLRLGFQSGR
ncbi:hypothetical protein ACFPMF_12470 [Larkinella bovis]|uniref:Outer membrane protein beta-barrel domain-containing protein n=1 Tax=Larkinella bovis TaxID=683041 RepID=A0ABW0IC81_9BACT